MEYDDIDRREVGRIQERGLPELTWQIWYNESEGSDDSEMKHREIKYKRREQARSSRYYEKKREEGEMEWQGRSSKWEKQNPYEDEPRFKQVSRIVTKILRRQSEGEKDRNGYVILKRIL